MHKERADTMHIVRDAECIEDQCIAEKTERSEQRERGA